MSDKFDSVDLKALRGDTETYTFSVTQNSVGYDLSAYSVQATGRLSSDESERLFNLGITSLLNGSDFSVGKVVMQLPAELTASLPNQFSYDVQATKDSTITTLVRGIVSVYEDLTK